MKTLIIFDIDGTLVHSNKIDSNCFSQTYLDIYGEKFPSIDWRVYPHVTDHTIFGTVIQERFGRKPDQKEINIFQNHFVNLVQEKRVEIPEAFHEVPGAKVMIDRLIKDDRFEIGVATGGWEAPARIKLKFVGINTSPMYMSFADNKITREDIVQESIDLAKAVHSDFQRMVYVGDAIWDVKTTRQMGLPLIGIRVKGDQEVLLDLGTEKVLTNYLDYEQFLEAVVEATVPV